MVSVSKIVMFSMLWSVSVRLLCSACYVIVSKIVMITSVSEVVTTSVSVTWLGYFSVRFLCSASVSKSVMVVVAVAVRFFNKTVKVSISKVVRVSEIFMASISKIVRHCQ